MSLKARLEAVIYAAEEPVTLAQLAGLFAREALAWQAAREVELSEPVLTESESPTLEDALPIEEPGMPAESVQAESAPESANVPPDAQVEAELEARRRERQREREVRQILRTALDELIAEYAQDTRGIEIREIAGGFRMGTKPEMHDAVRAFVKSQKPALKLSLPALETLAVIAYKQPVTAPEVAEIRGVDSAGVLGSLMSRKLIATAGRKQVIGRPMLYKTTKEFLLRFGLRDVHELPSMEEFEKMAALELSEEPGNLDDPESDNEASTEQVGDLFPEEIVTKGDLSKTNATGPGPLTTGGNSSLDALNLSAEADPMGTDTTDPNTLDPDDSIPNAEPA
jgi:segregation and condensation protein B